MRKLRLFWSLLIVGLASLSLPGLAKDVLGEYANGWEIDYYCDWLVWDLDAP